MAASPITDMLSSASTRSTQAHQGRQNPPSDMSSPLDLSFPEQVDAYLSFSIHMPPLPYYLSTQTGISFSRLSAFARWGGHSRATPVTPLRSCLVPEHISRIQPSLAFDCLLSWHERTCASYASQPYHTHDNTRTLRPLRAHHESIHPPSPGGPTPSSLDEFWCIHADLSPDTDNLHSAGFTARFDLLCFLSRFTAFGSMAG